MKEAEVSIKETRITEAMKNLVSAFNHVTVLMAGANGEERIFLNEIFKNLNKIRLQFVGFYSKENREERSKRGITSGIEITETPPELDGETIETLIKSQMPSVQPSEPEPEPEPEIK